MRGRQGTSQTPRPSQVTGGVGESRLGRRDPRDAQAGAAKRRAPVRGKHYRNHRREIGKGSQSNAKSKSPGGKEEEDGEGGGERRSSKRRGRKVNGKRCRRGLLGVSLTLKGHKLIETRGRRETKDKIQLGLPEIAENIRTRASAGDENFKIVELQQLKFHKGKN